MPPFGHELTLARERQLVDLAEMFDHEKANLLVGDFNVAPWSPSFARILRTGNLSDATKGFGIAPTLAPIPTWFGGLKVDHVLRSKNIGTVDFRVVPNSNSDHHMLVYDFEVLGGGH